jgi:hypothetical protein
MSQTSRLIVIQPRTYLVDRQVSISMHEEQDESSIGLRTEGIY